MHAFEAAGIGVVPTLFRAGIKLFNQTRRSIAGVGKRSAKVDGLPKWDFNNPVESAVEQAEDEVLNPSRSSKLIKLIGKLLKALIDFLC